MTARQDALHEVRAEIDQLDRRIVTLLAEREKLVRRAGQLKSDATAVRAPVRVEEVVNRARTAAREVGATPDVVERTYRAMISAFIDLELATLRADDATADASDAQRPRG